MAAGSHFDAGRDKALAQAGRRMRVIETVCRAALEGTVTPLNEAASQAALSPHHFLRVFARIAGLTPRALALIRRKQHACTILADDESVLDAAFGSGFGSAARFYEAFAPLGMQPRQYGRGGAGVALSVATAPLGCGWLTAAATPNGLCWAECEPDRGVLRSEVARRFYNAVLVEDPALARTLERVAQATLARDPGAGFAAETRRALRSAHAWSALERVLAPAQPRRDGTAARKGDARPSLGNPRSRTATAAG